MINDKQDIDEKEYNKYPAVESTAIAEGFSIFPPQSVKQRSKFELHTKTFE